MNNHYYHPSNNDLGTSYFTNNPPSSTTATLDYWSQIFTSTNPLIPPPSISSTTTNSAPVADQHHIHQNLLNNPSSSSILLGHDWNYTQSSINVPVLQLQQPPSSSSPLSLALANAKRNSNIDGKTAAPLDFCSHTPATTTPNQFRIRPSSSLSQASSIPLTDPINSPARDLDVTTTVEVHTTLFADHQNDLYFTGKTITLPTSSSSASESPFNKAQRGRPPKRIHHEIVLNIKGPPPEGLFSSSKQRTTLSCSTCHKTFTALASLKRHEIRHSADPQPFHCNICNRKFTQSSTLATHKREIHEGIRDRFECQICHQKFTRSSGLSVHLKNLHPKTPDGSTILTTSEKPLRKRIMLDPNRSSSPSRKWNSTQCPICLKQFKKARYCWRHMGKHSEERPYKCSYCDKSCYREDDLKRHVEGHLDIRRYASRYCGQRFRRKRNMMYHEKIHEESGLCYNNTSRNLKQCKICSETCRTSFLYKQHFSEKHQRECLIPLQRLESIKINPICLQEQEHTPGDNNNGMSKAESNSCAILCNTCGNSYTSSDYMFHRVLCDKFKTIVWTWDDEGAQVRQAVAPEKKEEVVYKAKRTGKKIKHSAPHQKNFTNVPSIVDNDYCNTFNGSEFEPLESQDPIDMKPSIDDFELSNNQFEFADETTDFRTCKLCNHSIPNSKYDEHLNEEHFNPIVVCLNKTLFKPLLSTELRSICEVKAHDDTFNVPWYMCAKCGRIYLVKTQAKYHKLHKCINKYKYNVVIRETKKSSSLQDSQMKKEAEQIQENIPKSDSDMNTEQIFDRRIGTAREEHWTENWTEDLILDDLKIKYDEIKLSTEPDGKPQCLICKKYFKDEAGARAHMIVHREKKWFCEHCGETFVWKELYKAHLRKHTGERPFPCKVCGKPFREPVGRFVHEKSHLSIEEKLKAKQLRKEALAAKKSVAVEKEDKPSEKVRKEVKYVCSLCSVITTTKPSLQRHMIVMHPSNGVKPKFFDCKFCTKSYSLVTSMKAHLRKKHVAQLPELLLKDDNSIGADGTESLNIENYFVRTNKELKRVGELIELSSVQHVFQA